MYRAHQKAKNARGKQPLTSDIMQPTAERPMFHKMAQLVARAPHLRQASSNAEDYRKYMLDQQTPFVDIPELGKSAKHSARVRQEGNRLYLAKKYDAALKKYNESICFAENDSEDLGIGYGNRSAIYFEMGEFEFALANIELAKKYRYPEKLMPKLLSRERSCKQKIEQGLSKGTVPNPGFELNVEPNPKIPFLANGICMKVLPEFGRSLVAEKNFDPGDVLLCEKPMIAAIDTDLKYLDCACCSIVHFNSLIPCPGCVSFMYCSEECMERDKLTHRFECGLAEKLQYMSYGNFFLGPRMFFYGLSVFKDNLQEMMEYCKSHAKASGNPLELDYVNADPLEEFKMFHRTESSAIPGIRNIFQFFAAAYFTVFADHPPVQALVKTQAEKDFMLKCFADYMQIGSYLCFDKWENHATPIGLVATVANHSCDPNTVVTVHSGKIKIVTLRPIHAGDQIFVSYGPLWWEPNQLKSIKSMNVGFDCRCVVCVPAKARRWRAAAQPLPSYADLEFKMLLLVLVQSEPETERPNLLARLQRFIGDYAQCHPNEQLFSMVVAMYYQVLTKAIMDELAAQQRAAAVEGLL